MSRWKEPPSLRLIWISLVFFFILIEFSHDPVIKRWTESTPEKSQNGAKQCHKVIYHLIELMMHKLTQLSFFKVISNQITIFFIKNAKHEDCKWKLEVFQLLY
jgi:hypothetical protein